MLVYIIIISMIALLFMYALYKAAVVKIRTRKKNIIEQLVISKGFEQCIAVVNENSASIVVKRDGLLANEVAQIKEIVYKEASISPKNITIIEKN